MAAAGILIGSAALACYGQPARPVADLDLILTPEGLAGLKVPIRATAIPGRWIGEGVDVTRLGLHPSHAILEQLIVGEVEVAGLVVGLPSLAALWAIKSGAMAYTPKRRKTSVGLTLIERMGGRSDHPAVLALEKAIRAEAIARLHPRPVMPVQFGQGL